VPADEPPDPQPTDEALLASARGGDLDAFARFYTRHRDWCLAFADRLTRNPDEATDVVQEVFCRLIDRIAAVHIRDSARAYLAVSIRNEVAARHRRRTAFAKAATHPPGPPADDHTTDPALHEAIQTLPPEQREILLLWAVQDLTHAQIADVLGQPPGTIKSRARAALAALRGLLGDDRENS
jgi:RNA polymerase sigma-70 factor (ECF subfamily)